MDASQQATVNPAKPKKGIFSSLGKTLSTVQGQAEKLVQDMSFRANQIRDQDLEPKWRQLFSLSPTERLLADYPAKAVNGDRIVNGVLFISYHNICFFSPNTSTQPVVAITIPFNMIKEIQQGVTVPSKTAIPAVVSCSVNPDLKPKVIQIFTNDNLVHQFILKSTMFSRVFVVLDHAYRTSSYFMGSAPITQNMPQPVGQQAMYSQPIQSVYTPGQSVYTSGQTPTAYPQTTTYIAQPQVTTTTTYIPLSQPYTSTTVVTEPYNPGDTMQGHTMK